MMKYEIEKRDFGSTWVHVIEENAKKETLIIEIFATHSDEDKPFAKDKDSLPYLWHKNGWTDNVMESYINCHTYVHDSEGGCYGGYNVTEKYDGKRNVINFDWLLEDTEENRKKIIEACIELFESATGKSATERKMEHVMEVAKERGMDVVSEIPEGWKKNPLMTDPCGAVTIDNGKPIFIKIGDRHKKNPEYKRMLLI